jgi:hypothetical protein
MIEQRIQRCDRAAFFGPGFDQFPQEPEIMIAFLSSLIGDGMQQKPNAAAQLHVAPIREYLGQRDKLSLSFIGAIAIERPETVVAFPPLSRYLLHRPEQRQVIT